MGPSNIMVSMHLANKAITGCFVAHAAADVAAGQLQNLSSYADTWCLVDDQIHRRQNQLTWPPSVNVVSLQMANYDTIEQSAREHMPARAWLRTLLHLPNTAMRRLAAT